MPVFARACGEGCKDTPPLWIYTKGTGDLREEVKPSLGERGFRGLYKEQLHWQYSVYGNAGVLQ
jgi:hypothetical protein